MKRQFGQDERAAVNKASSFWAFCREVRAGDYVVSPDSVGKRALLGKVISRDVAYEMHPTDGCEFSHRRKVKWLGYMPARGIGGGIQTVSRIRDEASLGRIRKVGQRLLKPDRAPQTAPRGLPPVPDSEWGRAAEIRAMQWLALKKPIDVTRLCRGWDIEAGGIRYEVKGRRSSKSAVKLSQREFQAARRYRGQYVLMVFTAKDEAALGASIPRLIPDPARTEQWRTRMVREYMALEI